MADAMDRQYPALRSKMGFSAMRHAIELANACRKTENGQELHLAELAFIDREIEPVMDTYVDLTSSWMSDQDFDTGWMRSKRYRSLGRLMDSYLDMCLSLLHELSPEERQGPVASRLLDSTLKYLNHIAFHGANSDYGLFYKYAQVGAWHSLRMGDEDFLKLVDGATCVSDSDYNHEDRSDSENQLKKDLPWIRTSVPFWTGRLSRFFLPDCDKLDPAAISHLVQSLHEANVAASNLGCSCEEFIESDIAARVLDALSSQDYTSLHKVFRDIAQSDSKSLLDTTGIALGRVAHLLGPAEFLKSLQIWQDEIDDKPVYFQIAWSAAAKAPAQALVVADLAAERFKDDPAFVAELVFMHSQLAEPSGTSSLTAPDPKPDPGAAPRK